MFYLYKFLAPAWSVSRAEMVLEERARSCLLRLRHKLEEDIKPAYLMDHMISDGVMTVEEEEKIKTQVSLSDDNVLRRFVKHSEVLSNNLMFRFSLDD